MASAEQVFRIVHSPGVGIVEIGVKSGMQIVCQFIYQFGAEVDLSAVIFRLWIDGCLLGVDAPEVETLAVGFELVAETEPIARKNVVALECENEEPVERSVEAGEEVGGDADAVGAVHAVQPRAQGAKAERGFAGVARGDAETEVDPLFVSAVYAAGHETVDVVSYFGRHAVEERQRVDSEVLCYCVTAFSTRG